MRTRGVACERAGWGERSRKLSQTRARSKGLCANQRVQGAQASEKTAAGRKAMAEVRKVAAAAT